MALSHQLSAEQWALYISGVRSSGHKVKLNMAANGGLIYVSLSLPTLSFMFTCIVKIAQGDWDRRNLGPPCPPCLASLFSRSATWRSHSIYIYIYGAHWCKIASSQSRPPGHFQEAGARWPPNSKWHTYKINLINYSHTLIFNLVSMQVKILIREKNEQHIVNFLPSLSRPICSCHFKFGGHLAQAPCKWPLGTKWSFELCSSMDWSHPYVNTGITSY